MRDWKDLPSEGWAEMMDFWHCHKPDEPHMHDHGSLKKGYAANSQLALKQGIAMVDANDFLLASEDCQDIAVGLYRSVRLYHVPFLVSSRAYFKHTRA